MQEDNCGDREATTSCCMYDKHCVMRLQHLLACSTNIVSYAGSWAINSLRGRTVVHNRPCDSAFTAVELQGLEGLGL